MAIIAEQLVQLYCDTFQFNPTLVNLSHEDKYAIYSYLDMNKLMVQCRQEASRVSPQTWEGILATLLIPNAEKGQG